MNTKEIGDISEAMLTAAFLRKGFVVLQPIGDRQRFDVVIDRGSGFERVQCKTGRLSDGAVRFSACSYVGRYSTKRKSYHGDCELFGVYCPDTGQCFLIPINLVGLAEGAIRTEPAKNGQKKHIRLANEFLI